MRPFVLRRLKTEVLKDLPHKKDEIVRCALINKQQDIYDKLIAQFTAEASEITDVNGTGMMMQLRKVANHPLLMRNYYDEDKLQVYKYMLKYCVSFHSPVLIVPCMYVLYRQISR